ncbi:hypothetical protein GTW29_20140 [Streptomyces sp. SID7834]|nr:hypothetical protein [Streptomyces sp. SID7834]MYT59004.1 hypothetical protein [Streptomyces sp. SID7834]
MSEAWTLTRNFAADQAPIRGFLEEGGFSTNTYTMREGASADFGAAQTWLDERSGPLPEPPEYGDHNDAVVRAQVARIALARSFGASTAPKTDLDGPRTAPVQRPVQQGRLL